MNKKVFFAHSFHADYRQELRKIRNLMRDIGLQVVDLQSEPTREISLSSFRNKIEECDALVAILTPEEGGTSTYVIQEIDLAQRLGLPVIAFRDRSIKPGVLGMLKHIHTVPIDTKLMSQDLAPFVHHLVQLVQLATEAHQVTDRVRVRVQLFEEASKTIKVSRLTPQDSLQLTPNTFFEGLRILSKQIKDPDPSTDFALIAGINTAGIIAASYLDGRMRADRRPLATIKSTPEGVKRERKFYLGNLPRKLNDSPHILIVDGETKSGCSTAVIRGLLQRRYPEKILLNASIVACGITQAPEPQEIPIDVGKLFRSESNKYFRAEPGCWPQFLAFTASGRIKHPDNIR